VTGVGRGITEIQVTSVNDPDIYATATVVVFSPEPGILELPSDLTAIGAGAFSCLSDAEAVLLPDDCTTIGAGAFEHCGKLLLVSLPGDAEIAGDAFDTGGEWIFICPQGEQQPSRAAAYAKGKGMRSFAEIVWISDEGSVPVSTE
jgi:hypothetical protein